VNFVAKTFSVTEKLDLAFTPKDKEEGDIPIPDSLVDTLRARRAKYPNTRLIFPNDGGKPNGHFLRTLKSLALRAGINCGHCYNKAGNAAGRSQSANDSSFTGSAKRSRRCIMKLEFRPALFNHGCDILIWRSIASSTDD